MRSTKHALTCKHARLFLEAQGTYEEVLQCYEEELEIYREKSGDHHVTATLNNIAQFTKARRANEKALHYCEE